MKAQCPQCENIFDIPDIYIGRMVKCLSCSQSFLASSKNIIETHSDDSEPLKHSNQPVTIEKTSKKWKGYQLSGILLVIASIFIIVISVDSKSTSAVLIGGLLFWVGIITYIIARIQAWWHHG